MSASIDLFPTGDTMKAAVMLTPSLSGSITEASGRPKENLLDNNTDSYYTPGSASTMSLDVDLGGAELVDAIIIRGHNYPSGFTGTLFYYYRDTYEDENIDNAAAVDKGGGLVGIPVTGHSWSAGNWVTIAGTTNYNDDYEIQSETANEVVITETYNAESFAGTETIWSRWYLVTGSYDMANKNGSLFIKDTSLSITHRYWRVQIGTPSHVINYPDLWLARKHTISIGNQWPEPDQTIYQNRSVIAPGGRRMNTAINDNSSGVFSRRWLFAASDATTQYGYLASAFNKSQGSLYPLILNEGATDTFARVVHFDHDNLNQNLTNYQQYEPTVRFREVPRIATFKNF